MLQYMSLILSFDFDFYNNTPKYFELLSMIWIPDTLFLTPLYSNNTKSPRQSESVSPVIHFTHFFVDSLTQKTPSRQASISISSLMELFLCLLMEMCHPQELRTLDQQNPQSWTQEAIIFIEGHKGKYLCKKGKCATLYCLSKYLNILSHIEKVNKSFTIKNKQTNMTISQLQVAYSVCVPLSTFINPLVEV